MGIWKINDPLFLSEDESIVPVMNGMMFVDGSWVELTIDDICERMDDIFSC